LKKSIYNFWRVLIIIRGDTMISNFKIFVCALPALFLFNPLLFADVGVIEEVVITAQKKEESLQDTPIALTAISESTINDLDIKNGIDLNGIAPNVFLMRMPANNTGMTAAIRGGVTMNPAITWEPTVGIYLDGVYLGKNQGAIFDVVDLERVEVLRGPQGTLYGRNTLAGAINFISKRPSGEGASAKVTIGNYGLKQSKFIADYEIGENIFTKLVVSNKKRDGYVMNKPSPYQPAQGVIPNNTNPIADELDTIDSKGIKFTLSFEGDATRVALNIDKTDQDNTPPLGVLTNTIPNWSEAFGVGVQPAYGGLKLWPIEMFTANSRQSTASIDANVYETSVVEGTSLSISHDMSLGTVKAIWSKRKLDWDDSLDLDGGPFPIAATQRHTNYSSETFELQLTGSTDSMSYILGYYALDDNAYTSNPQSFFGGGSVFAQNYSGAGDATALFGQVTFALGEKWDVTLGARSTEEDKNGFKEYVGVISAKGSGSFDDTSTTFILSHDFSENTNLYFKVADGFKAGAFNAEASNPYAASTPYAPETVQATEFGIKGIYLDNRLMFNAAIFQNEHEDMQLSYFNADAAAASEVINNSAEVSGLEIETTAYLNDSTKLMVNFGHLDPKYTDSKVAGDGYQIEQFPYSPENSLYVSLEKDFGAYRMRLDHNRKSEYSTNPYNGKDPRAALSMMDGYGVTDFRLLMEPTEDMALTFWIKNLTDANYAVNAIPFGPGFGQLTVSYFGAPRTIGMDISYKF
jgi:iron complex outermembrane receptor protein